MTFQSTVPGIQGVSMGRGREVYALLAIVVILGILGLTFSQQAYHPSTQMPQAPVIPTRLSFTVDSPDLMPSVRAVITVHVLSESGDAGQVALKSDSAVLQLDNSSADVNSGRSADLKLGVTASDIQDGFYNAKFWLHYLDSGGVEDSSPKLVTFYVLPHVVIDNPGWKPDWTQWLGKNTLKPSDSAVARFDIVSQSKNVTYQGLVAKASFAVSGVGLAVQTQTVPINPVGPQGKSNEYTFTITSSDTPPGQYTLLIELFSKDGKLITQTTLQFSVTS